MGNMRVYDQVRAVPVNAQKVIGGGRLKGMTDINPMWRIAKLTEIYGPCGIGWRYVITDRFFKEGANGEVAAFVDIDLYVRENGEWSEAIPGTGGSMFVAKEKTGMYTSDECLKMALTDAISVSCKALGFGADVYWAAGRTKYSQPVKEKTLSANEAAAPVTETKPLDKTVWWSAIGSLGFTREEVEAAYPDVDLDNMSREQGSAIYKALSLKPLQA